MMERWTHFPTYPSGLRLAGRRVVVVGGGHVAQRRVPGLIAAGADVLLVSPEVTPAIEGLAGAGEIGWAQRVFEPSDLDGAWYVVAATDDRAANEAVTRGMPRSGGSSASAPTTPPARAPGRPPSVVTPVSPSPSWATATLDAPPRSGTRSSRGCARDASSRATTATAPPG